MFEEIKAALNDIDDLLKKTSLEPWYHIEEEQMFVGVVERVHGPDLDISGRTDMGRNLQPRYDAEFIARSRTLVPQLVDVIRTLLVEIEPVGYGYPESIEDKLNELIKEQKQYEILFEKEIATLRRIRRALQRIRRGEV